MNIQLRASTLLDALHVGGFLTKLETRRVTIERPDQMISIGEGEVTVSDLVDDHTDPFDSHLVGSDLADAVRYIKTGQTYLAEAILARMFGPATMAQVEPALRA